MYNIQLLRRQMHEPLRMLLPMPFCPVCQAALPLFVSDELAGLAVDTLYPEITYHLDLCANCQVEYEALSVLTTHSLYRKDML